jgi:hypothetical protein
MYFLFIILGSKAKLLQNGTVKLTVEFSGKRRSLGTNNLSSQTSSASSNKIKPPLKQTDTKPQLVVINSDKSKFSDLSVPSDSSFNSQDINDFKKNCSAKLKRKKPVIEDSDSDDLEFGDEFKSKPAIKKKASQKPGSSKPVPVCNDHNDQINQSESQNGKYDRSMDDNCGSGTDSDIIIERTVGSKQTKTIMVDSDSE